MRRDQLASRVRHLELGFVQIDMHFQLNQQNVQTGFAESKCISAEY